jgi:hypothetical protein
MYHGLGNRFLKVGVVSEVALNIFSFTSTRIWCHEKMGGVIDLDPFYRRYSLCR